MNKWIQIATDSVAIDEIVLASWDDRFWAWLIDFILTGILWQRIMTSMRIDVFAFDGAFLYSIFNKISNTIALRQMD